MTSMMQRQALVADPCPAWCRTQDCYPDEPVDSGVFHRSPAHMVRVVESDTPLDVEVSVELWRATDGDHADELNVILGLASFPGEVARYSRMLDLTPDRARRLAALLVDAGDLAESSTPIGTDAQ